MNDINLYYTDLEQQQDFWEHPNFVPVSEYSKIELKKTPSEEFGKISIKGLNLHLVYDTGRQKCCPWCCHPDPEIIREDSKDYLEFSKFYARCSKCLARGPTLNVSPLFLHNQENIDETMDFVLHRWATRIKRSVEMPSERMDQHKA